MGVNVLVAGYNKFGLGTGPKGSVSEYFLNCANNQ